MASWTFKGPWLEGDSVAAYDAVTWPGQLPPDWGVSPLGTALEAAAVTDGAVTFTVLGADHTYVLGASTHGQWRYVMVHTRDLHYPAILTGDTADDEKVLSAGTGLALESLDWDVGETMGSVVGGVYDGGAIDILHTTPATGGSAGLYYPVHVQETFLGTDATSPTRNTYRGLSSTVNYGDALHSPTGTVHGQTTRLIVHNSGNAGNEHGVYVGYLRYSDELVATPGRAWFTDWGLHGAIGVQQSALNGITMVVNNHYNGQPSQGPAGGMWLATGSGMGFGADAAHNAADTFPVGVGLGIAGKSTGGTHDGFTAGLMVGTSRLALIGSGTASGWGIANSQVDYGAIVTDWRDAGLWISNRTAGATGPGIHFRSPAGGALHAMIEGRVEGDAVPGYFIATRGYMEWGNGTDARDVILERGAADQLRLGTDDALVLGAGVGTGKGFLGLWEQSADPAAPAADGARLFTRDNAGKTQLCVIFSSGATQVIATQP